MQKRFSNTINNMPVISLYPHIKEARQSTDIPFDQFIRGIQSGLWKDQFLDVYYHRADPVALRKAKETVPYVTISGKFSERKNSGLVEHSGFIAIDIDDVEDPAELKSLLCVDRYVYAAFTSISGSGLCVVVKINGNKHLESFEGLQEYLFKTYSVVIDPSCKDVSRPRYVSYDPALYINERADKFVSYVKKDKVINPTKVPDVVYVQDDFEMVLQEILDRHIDVTGSYHTWLRIGFSICDKFGEGGRQYYHAISQFSPTYLPRICDRQYTNCLKSGKSGVNIATFYYLAKHAGLNIISERTRVISGIADSAKRARTDKKAAIKAAMEAGFDNPEDIINQVFDNNIDVPDVSDIEAVEFWLKENYSLKRNSITRYIESSGVSLQKKDFNTIWVAARKVFEKVAYQDLERLIDSDSTITYNPLHDFINTEIHRTPLGLIDELFRTIETDTGEPDYLVYFGKKWFVGIISSIYGTHSPLQLILTGIQQTGKTEFFRRLLPEPLRKYYAESKLDAGKDDEILMTQKLIIVNDEMGGQTAKDEKRMKELLSKQVFSLREPYGKGNVDLVRLGVLGGNTNILQVLGDPTGNRRVIPGNVKSINHAAYNAIDKTDLFIEAVHLYRSGFKWELTKEDAKILKQFTGEFEKVSAEKDLILKYFEVPTENNKPSHVWLTSTEIKSRLEVDTRQQLNVSKLGQELKNLGFIRDNFSRGNNRMKGYKVVEISSGPYVQDKLPVVAPMPF